MSIDWQRYNAAAAALDTTIRALEALPLHERKRDSDLGRAYMAARATLNQIPGRHDP